MFWDPVLQDSLVGNKLHSNTGCKENERRCESNSQPFQSLNPEQEVHGTSVYMGILPNGCYLMNVEKFSIKHVTFVTGSRIVVLLLGLNPVKTQ